MHRTIKLISHEDILKTGILDCSIAETSILESFKKYGNGDVFMPKKTILKPEFSQGQVNIMPCVVNNISDCTPLYSMKIIGAHPDNSDNNVPNLGGIAILFDSDTAYPVAIMDVEVLSAYRTGAVSAVCAKYLINKKPKIILLIGAGLNMKTQFLALKSFIDTNTEIYVYSRGDSKHKFIQDMQLSAQATAIDDVELVAKKADLIIGCIPNLGEPVINNIEFKPGVTFFNIGLIDISPQMVNQFDKIIVDDWECSKARGDAPHVIAYEHGYITDDNVESIVPYILKNALIRTNDAEKIFFSPVGLSTHDAILAYNLYNKATELGLGYNFTMSQFTQYI